MFDQLFRNEDLRERTLAGPMGPYLDVLASRLLELGYCHPRLAEPGLTPADAGKAELEQYLARTPKGRVTKAL